MADKKVPRPDVQAVMYDVSVLVRRMIDARLVPGADSPQSDPPTPEWIAAHDAWAALMASVHDLAVRAADAAAGEVEYRFIGRDGRPASTTMDEKVARMLAGPGDRLERRVLGPWTEVPRG